MRSYIIVLLICLCGTVKVNAQGNEERPNILWIVSEDTSPLLGCYGDSFATTPNIDRFATESVVFDNAFSTAPACAPSRSTLITGMLASSTGTENMRSSFPIPEFIKFFPRYLRKAGYYTTNNAKEDYNMPHQPEAWDESNHQASYLHRKDGQPFFSIYNLGSTHESKVHRQVKQLHHDPDKVPIPPYNPRTKEMENDWALFYDNIETMDSQVGEILRDLEEAGLAENTIVFYYSDHGGVIARSKRFIFDSGLKVPLVIRFPKKYQYLAPGKRGSRTDQVVSFEDFAPTVLNLAGVKVPGYMQGQPFLGKKVKEQEYAFAFRGRIDERIDFVRSIRNKQFRYVRNYLPQKIYGQHVEYQWQAKSIGSWEQAYHADTLNEVQSAFWETKPSEELYDISADPNNVHNLADNQEYEDVLTKLRHDYQNMILKTKDTGFIPEAMKLEISKAGTIYEFAQSKDYPLKEILKTAEMATSRDPSCLEELTDRLSNKNTIIQYWAAMGCRILGGKARSSWDQLTPLLESPEPLIQIVAADALYNSGYKGETLPTLEKALKNENLFVRLQAITVLEGMENKALPALPDIEQLVAEHSTKKMEGQPLWKAPHDVKIAKRLILHLNQQSSNH